MDITQCYEILELNPDASIDEVQQAYKDLVNIWHPDRVSHNPRLKQKAEEKLKQINAAHEGLLLYLNGRPQGTKAVLKASRPRAEGSRRYQEADPHSESPGRSETRVKTGTGRVSTLWSYLSDLLHNLGDARLAPRDGTGAEPDSSYPRQGCRQGRGIMGGGMGAGRGRGTGRGGRGGMGRGKGRGGR